jgi:hypothetical protein
MEYQEFTYLSCMKNITLLLAIFLIGFTPVAIGQGLFECSTDLISDTKTAQHNQSVKHPEDRIDMLRQAGADQKLDKKGYLYVKKNGYWILVNEDCWIKYYDLKWNCYFKSNTKFAWADDLDTKPVAFDLEVHSPKKWKVD